MISEMRGSACCATHDVKAGPASGPPVLAMGDRLIKRLSTNAGMTFEVEGLNSPTLRSGEFAASRGCATSASGHPSRRRATRAAPLAITAKPVTRDEGVHAAAIVKICR